MKKIWLDVSGWDRWPEVRVEWAIMAILQEHDFNMVLYWNKIIIDKIIALHGLSEPTKERIEVINSTGDIPMDTDDKKAVSKNKESSMSLLLDDLKPDWEWLSKLDAWITAWNTWVWVLWALSKLWSLKVNWIKLWQAMWAFIPKQNWWETFVLDFWATILWNTKEKIVKAYLSNALMAISYLKARWIVNPKLWLINIWEEENKWSEELQEVYKKLKELFWDDFIWNIEWNLILNNDADILLTDATTWNHLLKMWEWVVKNVWVDLKKLFNSSIFFKIIGFLIKPKLREIFRKYESKKTGWAITLWVNNLFYITHWSADSELIKYSILRAYEDAEKWVREKTRDELELLISSLPEEFRIEVWNK